MADDKEDFLKIIIYAVADYMDSLIVISLLAMNYFTRTNP